MQMQGLREWGPLNGERPNRSRMSRPEPTAPHLGGCGGEIGGSGITGGASGSPLRWAPTAGEVEGRPEPRAG